MPESSVIAKQENLMPYSENNLKKSQKQKNTRNLTYLAL